MYGLLLTITKYSYIGIFAALGLGILGIPVPDETLMAFAGFLAFQGKLNFFLILAVAFAGTSCGITISYFLGRYCANFISRKYPEKFPVNSNHLLEVKKFYGKFGKYALLLGYFIPGVRHLTAIFAGTTFLPYRQFALFAYIGAFLWTVTFLILGYFLGHEWYLVAHFSNRIFIPLIILPVLILFLIVYLKKKT
jgi:Uncharacterized membrane-associated protein